MKWTSTKDSLPREALNCLVYVAAPRFGLPHDVLGFVTIAGLYYGRWEGADLGLAEVTHWMPIPEPPTANGGKK